MSSALKLTYGGYTTGFVSRAADGVLSMTTGSATATNSSVVLRDATVASAETSVASERFEHNVRRVGWLNCGIWHLNGRNGPKLGMYYSAVGATALNTNIYAPGCSPIAVPQFAVNALTGNTYVNGTLTVNGAEMRMNVVVISADVSGAIYAANSSNPSIFLRAEGVDVIKLNKTKFYSLVARQTTLDTDGLDLRIDNDGKIGLPASLQSTRPISSTWKTRPRYIGCGRLTSGTGATHPARSVMVSIFPSRNGCTNTSNLCSSQSTPSRSSRSAAATVMEPVNVPPPTLAVDPAGVPNPPVEPTDEIEIEFADKVKRNIKASWQRQVPLLASSKIMRSSPMRTTKRELEMVRAALLRNGASEEQLQSVSDGSGFTRQINKVRDYINSHETACFNRSYRNATTQFAAQWDKYVAVLGAKLQCEKMESLFTLLRDTVVSKDIYSLLDLNLKYRNVVYEFFDWFDAFVIRGDREGLVRRTVDVALNIDMRSSINKETIIAKLASIAQVSELRGQGETSA
ncbi:hypothetical protein PAPYR_6581 [Paratrimastix pyriformis]|uniref:Uncharacterized protein n=1 Tax=Paratrimastix pyriformis TaxID=342808 RepID=A0ABQ8UF35_9EUKA|nr:hypothetical protein PAPYR_6581 [Paratrimastix pyriformis]